MDEGDGAVGVADRLHHRPGELRLGLLWLVVVDVAEHVQQVFAAVVLVAVLDDRAQRFGPRHLQAKHYIRSGNTR